MRIIFDWTYIIIGTIYLLYAYNNAFKCKDTFNRTACFVQLVIYLFNCFPILLDYLIGIPSYEVLYWWRSMGQAMDNDVVCIIYDIYMLFAMTLIHFLNIRKNIKLKNTNYIDKDDDKKGLNGTIYINKIFDNKFILLVCIFSPVISILIKGNLRVYLFYGMTETRGVTEAFSLFSMNNLLLLSMVAFCMMFFRKKLKKRDIAILIIYSFMIAWICGKRYIIADMIFMYLFFFVQSKNYTKKIEKKLYYILPLTAVVIVLFSIYYLISFKNSTLISKQNTEAVYETLRADFGRDDVTKYVIKKEFIDEDSFLDYPLESFLSAVFVWVPRSIWKNKPYQHFEYLTASIKGVEVQNHGPGMTPSWYEMALANFKEFGFLIGALLVSVLCKITDSIKSIELKSISLMMIIALLTQSIDGCIIYIAIIMITMLWKFVIGRRTIVIRVR
jgi:hypothetical protein